MIGMYLTSDIRMYRSQRGPGDYCSRSGSDWASTFSHATLTPRSRRSPSWARTGHIVGCMT